MLQEGVRERDLIEETTTYLLEHLYEDRSEAEHAAKQFVEHCRGRLWVFSNVGSTADAEELYRFTHPTFLEYFTAAWLVSYNPLPQTLAETLLPRIKTREWDVVAQLAFQIQSKQTIGAADTLLGTLLNAAEASQIPERSFILSFVARSLGFLVPKPQRVRGVAEACLNYGISWSRLVQITPGNQLPKTPAGLPSGDLISGLLRARPENLRTLDKSIVEQFTSRILQASEDEATVIWEIAMGLPLLGAESIWNTIVSNASDRRTSLAQASLVIAIESWYHGTINSKDLIMWHTLDSFCSSYMYRINPSAGRPEILNLLGFCSCHLASMIRDSDFDLAARFEDIAAALLHIEPPWWNYTKLHNVVYTGAPQVKSASSDIDDWLQEHPGPTFGITLICAIRLEFFVRKKNDWDELAVFNLESKMMPLAIRPILYARLTRGGEDSDQAVEDAASRMRVNGFSADQQKLLLRWINHDVDFIS